MSTPSTAWHLVYLALGSNLGIRSKNLENARNALEMQGWLRDSSSIYETPPWGIVDQPAFLNQVVRIETSFSPVKLLSFLKRLEIQLGRTPAEKYGPRLIDIDILFYNNKVIDRRKLKIPHPRLAERAFVLVPLADLAPQLRHPVNHKSISEMLNLVDISGIRRYPTRAGSKG
ncbi:MAG: 2-amino-4-hydroxy-6-hydroxymethyldihydropteridine diphosphokinase [Chloroflexi bacterium RBG_16_54_18]|nr:MAG: 2-amino-4-hydroxy-6-hydroxymethyldihydropteridine diphosphokinase [Chloroflexi bacterium RBG_16_54_18]